MKAFDFLAPDLRVDDDEPEGYRAPYARIGPVIGAERLAGTIVVLGRGESLCPYHYEVGEEEWLVVLDGTPAVRTPDGEEILEAGDVVCFPRGPEGAHKIGNHAEAPATVIVISERAHVAATFYEDSDKVGVFAPDTRLLFPRTAAVDYWLGEGPAHNDEEPPEGGSSAIK